MENNKGGNRPYLTYCTNAPFSVWRCRRDSQGTLYDSYFVRCTKPGSQWLSFISHSNPIPLKEHQIPPKRDPNERSNAKPMFLQWYVILRDGLSTRDGPSFAPQVDCWLSHICWISQKGILDTSSSPQREVSWRFRPSKRQSADEENSCWGTQRLDFASCWNAKSGIYSSASKQIAIWNFLNSQWNWIGRIYELTRFWSPWIHDQAVASFLPVASGIT